MWIIQIGLDVLAGYVIELTGILFVSNSKCPSACRYRSTGVYLKSIYKKLYILFTALFLKTLPFTSQTFRWKHCNETLIFINKTLCIITTNKWRTLKKEYSGFEVYFQGKLDGWMIT